MAGNALGVGRGGSFVIMRIWLPAMASFLLVIAGTAVGQAPQGEPLFKQGEHGYKTCRIPALLTTKSGALLAFCEGRKGGLSDAGDIDLLVRRSEDHGKTWSEQQVIWDDGANTCGNPAPVLDVATGRISLLATWNLGEDIERKIIAGESKDTRRVFLFHSEDDGRTWTPPREITGDTKKSEWTWYATGPGAGIQITQGENAGRLVIPCDHIERDTKHYYSHVIYSDDHGEHWKLGGRTPQHQVNECQVVELKDGRLLLNMRNYDPSKSQRQIAFSTDAGESWSGQGFDDTLVEPICQASIRRVGDAIYFSNPADPKKRINMTMRKSLDEGRSWETVAVLHPGHSAYSDLTALSDGRVACLYEAGIRSPYEALYFVVHPSAP